MQVKYLRCSANECGQECTMRYRLNVCNSRSRWMCYQLENTNHTHQVFNEEGEHSSKSVGIAIDTKKKILKLFFDKDIMRPYRIHVRLKEYYDQGKISMFPSLKQVQNFITYEKKKTGIYIIK